MYNCPKCLGNSLIKRGSYYNKTEEAQKQRYCCSDCKFQFSVEFPKVNENSSLDNKRYVITSCQDDTEINESFYQSLMNYCEVNDCELIILGSGDSIDGIQTNNNNFNIGEYIKVYGNLNISKIAETPLVGLEGICRGKSIIVGHNVLQYKTLPVFGNDHPIMMASTGTISKPSYNVTRKNGAKADYNHSNSAIVLELDSANDIFHIRVLNCDSDNSFFDIDAYYTPYDVSYNHRAECIYLGDTHVTAMDINCHNATFQNNDSIVNVTKPKVILHGDLLDFGIQQSHHLSKSIFKRYKKYIEGKDSIQDELEVTAQYLIDHTPDFVEKVLIQSSNHNEHYTRYLTEVKIEHDMKNAKLYYLMMYKMLDAIDNNEEANPFKIYFKEFCKNETILDKVKFLEREDLYYIKDILISSHGDIGTSGSRGSNNQFRRYPVPMILGHQHNPAIINKVYVAGTMTGKQEYQHGSPSANMQAHVLIFKNGERQIISIIKGKWRLN